MFRWLKNYMPRSLYGRAALILILPVVVLQLVVSVAFLERNLDDVTKQMTKTVVREILMISGQVDQAENQQEVLAQLRPYLSALQIQMRFVNTGEVPKTSKLRWYDYTGRIAKETLTEQLPNTLRVVLPDNLMAYIFVQSEQGIVELALDRRRLSPAAPHQLFVTMVFFGVLMTSIAFLYMRNQLRPITRLATAAQAFGRGRTVPYSPSGATEVRAAGSAFLDMRARIERQIEQRTLMLSGVSHDLRTPLTRLKLGLALLDTQDDIEPLLNDVDEMQRLLDAFLDFSRGTSEAEPEPVIPCQFIKLIVEDAKRSGKDVNLITCEGDGSVMLRTLALRRAVENLIGNAVQYGTKAEVSVVLTSKSLRIRVEDDGPGIAADKRTEAIKPFSRLDPARNQNRGSGVGLGLAIVIDIARAHGGTLRLGDSKRLGGLCADIVIAR
ncbi:two-component sensor histidine kinase [Phaeobacter gallaeciensis]|uniref:histidine kinase n=2 Tax=Roseobacteraceae TaxID=2854170 RepID=A0A366WP91_9RHOB|nr:MULTISPECIES: ATP-binding protein [Roseobacteraceae]MBT3140399.1 HAMP domain-containing protein [Falsiruegeria litorea]MBT8171184.1 HAMP domain-containing protein [Falsiruegeria litorea]RBW51720.1 two-component sensor histidine kinase [Phaeobacter gallaeciensis]